MTNQSCNTPIRRTWASLATAFAALTVFLVAIAFAGPALAQTSATSLRLAAAQSAADQNASSEALEDFGRRPLRFWQEAYPYQFKGLMRSPARQVREDALATLIALVQRPGYDQALKAPEAAKLLVPELLRVYHKSRRPAERKMAATAICFIGKEQDGIETLSVLSEKDRDRTVQRHAQRAITAHYLRTYPELGEWAAKRTGKSALLSKTRIEHAKRRQDRDERVAAEAAQETILSAGEEGQRDR